MTLEERVAAVERELAHQNELRGLREVNEKLSASQAGRTEAQLAETRKALPKLEAAMKELEDASIVTAAQTSRHETRLKEHQEWQEQMELAFARMAKAEAEFDEKMTQLASAQLVTEEKLQGFDEKMTQLASAQLVTEEKLSALIDALRRGGNGHQ